MNSDEADVADLLNVSDERAKEIVQYCYENIAQMQEDKEHQQIGKSIEVMQHVGKTTGEHFFAGFILGRIVQTHMIANFGLVPFLGDDITQVEKATNGIKSHPEFG